MPIASSPKGFTFDHENHIGRMDGVAWPSVTQLLQEAKYIDYSMVKPEVLENKRLIGIRVHAATILIDECRLDEEHFNKTFPECIPYLEAYRKFRVVENFDPAEKSFGRMFSKTWRFHGEPDEQGIRILRHDQEDYLIDYKCTWEMYESCGCQLAGYSILFKECKKISIKKRFGLLLKPTGNYDLVPFNKPSDLQDFQAALISHWSRREKYKTQRGVLTNGQYVE